MNRKFVFANEDINTWQKVENILCVRLDAMGDVLMTTPAISALKNQNSKRKITLLTSKAGQLVAEQIPEIDEIITFEPPWMKVSKNSNHLVDQKMIEYIKSLCFEASIIFTVYSQSSLPAALFCYLAAIPLRLAHCRENPYHLLSHWVVEKEPQEFVRHEVERQLDLVASIGCVANKINLSYNIPEHANEYITKWGKIWGLDWDRPVIVIHPGASAPSRRYRIDGFAEVADRLVLEEKLQVVFTGSREEEELILKLQSLMQAPSISLAGKLSLSQTAALLKKASLLLSNNTGPVHLAAAVKTKVVDLYALTNPQHTPWQVPSKVLYKDVPCRHCYKSICPKGHNHCLQLITPSEIIEAIKDLLTCEPCNLFCHS